MNRFPVRGGGGFAHGFAERRVRVDGRVDFLPGGFEFHREAELGDQLRGVGADDVRAEDFAGVGVR